MKEIKVLSVQRVALPRYIVKVYRTERAEYVSTPGLFTEIEQVARKLQEKTQSEIASALMEIDEVQEVEVIDWDNNGVLWRKVG